MKRINSLHLLLSLKGWLIVSLSFYIAFLLVCCFSFNLCEGRTLSWSQPIHFSTAFSTPRLSVKSSAVMFPLELPPFTAWINTHEPYEFNPIAFNSTAQASSFPFPVSLENKINSSLGSICNVSLTTFKCFCHFPFGILSAFVAITITGIL